MTDENKNDEIKEIAEEDAEQISGGAMVVKNNICHDEESDHKIAGKSPNMN